MFSKETSSVLGSHPNTSVEQGTEGEQKTPDGSDSRALRLWHAFRDIFAVIKVTASPVSVSGLLPF